jgi:hypothetical protein
MARCACYGRRVPDELPFSYFVVGAQKAGTSTLSQTLGRHPHICKAPRKEMRFFNREEIDWSDPPYEEYRCPRRKPQQLVAGDATPAYLWWPHALERIHDYRPSARLIAILRDPIERLFSHWSMMVATHGRPPDWPTMLRDHWATSLPAELPDLPPTEAKAEFSAISRGFYAAQLERGYDVFDREQWLVLEFRSMLADLPATLDQVTDHIGVRRYRSPQPVRHIMAGAASVRGTPPTGEEIARLAELYADDLERLVPLIDFDTSGWPTRRILAGELDPAELAARLGSKVTGGRRSSA